MKKILIAGIDTILGANLAVSLNDRYGVIGRSFSDPLVVGGHEAPVCPSHDPKAIKECVATERPDWLIYCGPASVSSWNQGGAPVMQLIRTPELMLPWAEAAEACGCDFTVISSDAVFTGPWIYHDEEDECFSENPAALAIRKMERSAIDTCRRTLVVRTNAYGWSPLPHVPGLIENILTALEDGTECRLDPVRHGAPILATDLAPILEQACDKGLSGLVHISGAERVSPYLFGEQLARRFGHSHVPTPQANSQQSSRVEFGVGETSLHCRIVRRELGIGLPLLREGLSRLHEQFDSGFRDQFGPGQPLLQGLVA